MTFADAMVDLVRATDGNGLPVHLYRGDWTASSLRVACREFMRVGIDDNTVWFADGKHMERFAEAAYWENLAKLANATAAAIREGR